MADIGGRRWVRDFLTEFHVLDRAADTVFASNALTMAKQAGERNAALKLADALQQANPDAFSLMLKEARLERHGNPDSEQDDTTDADADPGA
jgi:hypothetical protein